MRDFRIQSVACVLVLALTSCARSSSSGKVQFNEGAPNSQNGGGPVGGPSNGVDDPFGPGSDNAVAGNDDPGLDQEPTLAEQVGLSEAKMEEGRLYVNGWDGSTDEIPAGTPWQVISIADPSGSAASTTDSRTTTTTTNTTGSTTTASVAYNTQVKALLDRACVSCHRPGGSQPTSPMDTYQSAKGFGPVIVQRVKAGTMPPGGALSAADQKLLEDWQAAGFPENQGQSSTDQTGQVQVNGNAVTFTIPAQLVNGAWNTPDTAVVVPVGGSLTVVNNTNTPYWIHTDGAPFPHPGDYIQPGQQETYVIQSQFDGFLYNHTGTQPEFRFYIRTQ